MKKNQFENFMKKFFSLFLIKLFNINQSLACLNIWKKFLFNDQRNPGKVCINKLKSIYKSNISKTVFRIKIYPNESNLFEQFKNFLIHFFFLIWINFFFLIKKNLPLENFQEFDIANIQKFFRKSSPRLQSKKTKIFSLIKFSISIDNFKNAKSLRENFDKKKKPIKKKKIKISSGFINLPVLLKKINNFVHKYSLKGFTKDSIRNISFLTNSFIKNLISDLGKISLLRQKNSKKFLEEYGVKAIKNLKSPFLSENKFKSPDKNFYGSLKYQIKFYKKKHEKINRGPTKGRIQIVSSQKKNKLDEKKKKHLIIEENIKKTNKTLSTLLNGILQKRIAALKETTKCLCKYKPLPIKLLPKEKNNTLVNLERKKTGIFRIENFSRSMVTGLDCINLMKNQRKYFNNELIKKMVAIIGFDYNLRFNN